MTGSKLRAGCLSGVDRRRSAGKAAVLILAILVAGVWAFIAYRQFQNKTPATGPTPPTPTITPTPAVASTRPSPADPIGYAGLPVEWTVAQPVTAATGGKISSADGVTIDFPPGALAVDRTITVKRLKPVSIGEPSIVIDVDAGDQPLAADAIVTLPAPKDPRIPAERRAFRAIHSHHGKRSELPVAFDAATGNVTIKTKQFSHIHLMIFAAGAAWELFLAKGTEFAIPNRVLDVPFYPQGDAGWCWAACSTMMRKRYGVSNEIWDTAAEFSAPIDQGFDASGVLTRSHIKLIETGNLSVDATKLGFYSAMGLGNYLRAQIDEGRPVWVALPAANHVVVVVGADINGLYIHDPSGELLDKARTLAGQPAGGDEVDRKLCRQHISWKVWETIVTDFSKWTGMEAVAAKISPVAHTMVVIGGEETQSPTLTATIHDKDIEFHHPDYIPGDKANPSLVNTFAWDGTAAGGFRFRGLSPVYQGLPFTGPTNSDRLGKFVVSLNNTAGTPAKCKLKLLLDQEEFRSVDVEVPAYTTNFPVDFFAAGPHDFRKQPLAVGKHELRVQVEQGIDVPDAIDLPFVMGPSRPEGLKAERTTAKTISLKWDAVPEKGVKYVVYRDRAPWAITDSPTYETADDGAKHDWTVEAIDTGGAPLDVAGARANPDFPSGHVSEKAAMKEEAKPVKFEFVNVTVKDITDPRGQPVRVVLGEVKNVSGMAVTNPIINIKGAKASHGDFPAGSGLPGDIYRLPDGGMAPFRILTRQGGPLPPEFEVSNIHKDDEPQPKETLAFENAHIGVNWPPPGSQHQVLVRVETQLKNTSTTPTSRSSERVVATFYDDAGKVIGVGSGLAHSHGDSIAPGQIGSYPSLETDLLADSFSAYRLTAMAGDKHITTTYRQVGKLAMALEHVPARGDQPAQLRIINKCLIPVFPCYAGMNRISAVNQGDAKPVPPGGSVLIFDAFSKKRVPSPGCWFPIGP